MQISDPRPNSGKVRELAHSLDLSFVKTPRDNRIVYLALPLVEDNDCDARDDR
jgi:hypothetical protein